MKTNGIRNVVMLLVWISVTVASHGQGVSVTGKIVSGSAKASRTADLKNVIFWLMPRDEVARRNSPAPAPQKSLLVQKDKAFHPKFLVLPAGSSVEFPNKDPFFHNVFSLFNGKRFDLGLYEAGESRVVHFDRVGISYIFCNIHPEMSAIIVTLNTPYYATSNEDGTFAIRNVLPGVYELHVFADGLSNEAQRKLVREITVKEEPISIGKMMIPERQVALHHSNKYGHEYDTPPASPYEH